MWWSLLAFFVGCLAGRSVWFMRRMRSMNVAEARANAEARAAAQASATGIVVVADGLGTAFAGGVPGAAGVLDDPVAGRRVVHGGQVTELVWDHDSQAYLDAEGLTGREPEGLVP